MGSMSNAYTSLPFNLDATRRRAIGRLILASSGVLFVVAVLAGTTDTFGVFGLNNWQSWEVAGIAGGIALPTAIAGTFLLLPSSEVERRLAVLGSALAVLGVFLFWLHFPNQWHNDPTDYTFRVVATYFIGAFATFSSVFFAASNIDIQSKTEVVFHQLKSEAQNVITTNDEQPSSQDTQPSGGTPTQAANSGVGFLGNPDQDVEESRDAEFLEQPQPDPSTDMVDRYCGNCKYFQYKQSGDNLQPYCGFHDESMENLDACPQWEGTTEE